MHESLLQWIFLILIILALVMFANKMRVAYPIVLVLGGLVLSFTSAFNHVTIAPEVVFFIKWNCVFIDRSSVTCDHATIG